MNIRESALIVGVPPWTMRRLAPTLLGAEKRDGRWHIPTATVARLLADRANQQRQQEAR